MKKHLILMVMFVAALCVSAKDLKTVRLTTEPPMTCNNCENKIKKNIRFEKGIHEITTDLKGQVVTVVYDADKTNEEAIVKAFDKIKYKATKIDGCDKAAATDACAAKKAGCCGAKAHKCAKEAPKCGNAAEQKCNAAKAECCKKGAKN